MDNQFVRIRMFSTMCDTYCNTGLTTCSVASKQKLANIKTMHILYIDHTLFITGHYLRQAPYTHTHRNSPHHVYTHTRSYGMSTNI
jgi:hypothetical protein